MQFTHLLPEERSSTLHGYNISCWCNHTGEAYYCTFNWPLLAELKDALFVDCTILINQTVTIMTPRYETHTLSCEDFEIKITITFKLESLISADSDRYIYTIL